MIEPVKMADFFAAFFSAAAIILSGALYALLFAYSRMRNMPRLMALAYVAYAVLFVSAIVLAGVANLSGSYFWMLVIVLMLVGYLFAPHAVWNLCVNTHAAACHVSSAVNNGHQPSAPPEDSDPHAFQRPCKEETS